MYFPRIPFLDEVQVFDRKLQYLNAAATEIEIDGNERLIMGEDEILAVIE